MRNEALHALQRLVFPEPGNCDEQALYARISGAGFHRTQEQSLQLQEGSSADFFSYFNAFSLAKWRSLRPDLDLHFQASGTGTFLVRWRHHRSEEASFVVAEERIDLDAGDHSSALPWARDLSDGFLAPVLICTSPRGQLRVAGFATSSQPRRAVRLGIVITHFNRQEQVQAAAGRIGKVLLADPGYADRVQLIIVDNSRNLPRVESPAIRVIPNRNLGGSGGFARGLLELLRMESFTHGLFMDDDASCPMEAIRRTLHALEQADEDRTAVAGAMLYEEDPCFVHENGARFEGFCASLDHGLDLREPASLFLLERPKPIGYAGWWFFAFPLENLKHFPFPFFVRGDDSSFSMANDFSIQTLNGVCSWQESFEEKISPTTWYLDTRYHLAHVLNGHAKASSRLCRKQISRFVQSCLDAYLYESAEAVLLAVEDILSGPDLWTRDLEMVHRRTSLQQLTVAERPRKLGAAELSLGPDISRRRRKRNRMLMRLTLNGLLLPRFLLRKQAWRVAKSFQLDPLAAFGHATITHVSLSRQTGITAHRDRWRHLRTLIGSMVLQWKLTFGFRKLSRSHQEAYRNLASRRFWEALYPESGEPGSPLP